MTSSCKKDSANTAQKPSIVYAPQGEVRSIVAKERAQAEKEQVLLFVLVSAPWCAPCVAFEGALKEGRLDKDLPNLRFLKFDADADADRLEAAGYTSKYVPFFSIPNANGSPGPDRFEGAVAKDVPAEQVIVRNLRALITK